MDTFFENSGEEKDSIKRFEDFLVNGKQGFFDLSTLELVIDHYLEMGDFKKAQKACEIGVEQYPFSGDLWLDLSQVHFGNGNLEEAEKALQKAEVYLPFDEDVKALKGNILICQEKYDEGIEFLEEVLGTTDEKSHICLQLGLAYMGMNQEDMAIEYFKEAIRQDDQNEEALFELSDVLSNLGKLEKALPFFQKVIDKDPYSSTAWFNLGVVYDKLGEVNKAIQAYDYSIAIDDDYSSAWFNLGVTYLTNEEIGKALECFKKVKEQEGLKDTSLAMYLGQCYHKLQAYDKAVQFYQASLSLDESTHLAWYGLGLVMDEQERWFESIHFYRKAYELNENNSLYALSLAGSEYKTGNIQSCLEYYQLAAELAPEDIKIWLEWSFVAYEQGDAERAVDLIFQGIEDNPGEAILLYRVCAYLMKAGRYKQAFTYLENALILDFDKHVELLEFFSDLETQKALIKVIDQFREEDVR